MVSCFHLGLLVVFHGKGKGIEHDGSKDGVLAGRRRGEGPQLVLDRVLRDVAPHWLRIERKFDAVSLRMGDYSDPIAETFTITKRIYTDLMTKRDLVFVKLTVLEGGLPF